MSKTEEGIKAPYIIDTWWYDDVGYYSDRALTPEDSQNIRDGKYADGTVKLPDYIKMYIVAKDGELEPLTHE